jgi:hypothetical protein
MVTQINIQAEIIDIRQDVPVVGDTFLVDTNVWVFQVYMKNPPKQIEQRRKVGAYTKYLQQVRSIGATPSYSGLILAELAHVIEREEGRIYARRNGIDLANSQVSRRFPKEYRHKYPVERAKVVAQIVTAWQEIKNIAIPLDLNITEETTNAALQRFKTQALDGYDLFLLEAIDRAGVDKVQVLTDDQDYSTVPDIQVFTSNLFVLQQAQQQNKLLVR